MDLKEAIEKQKQLNRMFEEEGLTDELLRKQIELNKIINEKNLHEEDFVQ